MGKNGSVVVLLFLLMIVLGESNAFNSRRLVAIPDPNGSSDANQDSPLSSPPPDDKKSDHPSNVEPKGLNDANTTKSAKNSSDLELNQGKNQDGKESKTFARESCKGLPTCSDQEKTMTACIQDFVYGSNNLSLLVQNQKDVDLKVNITFGASVNNNVSTIEIPAHGSKEVNIALSGDKSNNVILNAGNGDCELQIGQPTLVNSPSKSKDPQNTSNLTDANDPSKPKDDNNPVESPTKPKEENSLSADKKGDSPSKSKDVDNPSKPKDVENPSKSKEIDDPSKSKEVNDPSKSKDNDDPSKSKDNDDPSKSKSKDDHDPSKGENDPSKSKSKDDDDPPKPKDTGPPSTPKTSVDTPISQNNFLDQLTFYSKQVTPTYGAYLAFLVALIIGVSWAFCTFRKRRSGNGVLYQELEMGPTEPSNEVDVETAEGWEHDWDDDDWDEDKAIRSPGGGVQTKSISSNGLTSRATKKDDWDD